MLLESFRRGVSVHSCSSMFMGNQGLFLHRHVKVVDLQNRFWMCCLLTVMIGFLPVATKLLLYKQFQGSGVVVQGSAKLVLLTATAITRSYRHRHVLKEEMIWVMLFPCHTLLCPVCHHLKTAKEVWKMTFPRGVKKISCSPYLLCVHEKHISTDLTLSSLESVFPFFLTSQFWICPIFLCFSLASWWMRRKQRR